MACSDGSEAYTFAIALMEKAPQNIISKFLPIKAFDVDSEMVDSAKSGKINILGGEFKLIQQLGIDLKKYFINPTKPKEYSNDELYLYVNSASYDVAKCLSNATEFKQSDILTEIQNIKDDGNSIVMCRNVLPYLDDDYVNRIIETAKNKLKDGSLFIAGNYEHSKTYKNGLEFEEMLYDNGFYQPFPNHHNIFERISKERVSRLPLMYFIS